MTWHSWFTTAVSTFTGASPPLTAESESHTFTVLGFCAVRPGRHCTPQHSQRTLIAPATLLGAGVSAPVAHTWASREARLSHHWSCVILSLTNVPSTWYQCQCFPCLLGDYRLNFESAPSRSLLCGGGSSRRKYDKIVDERESHRGEEDKKRKK